MSLRCSADYLNYTLASFIIMGNKGRLPASGLGAKRAAYVCIKYACIITCVMIERAVQSRS